MGLTRIAVARPIFIWMLIAASLLLGTISLFNMRIQLNPDVNFGVITVSTVYPGAGPDEVATLVSRKIEEALSGIPGLQTVTSTSQEGISVVSAQFEIGIDIDAALNEARSKVDAVVAELPADAEKPVINKFDTGSTPVMFISVSSDTLSSEALRDLLDNEVADRLAQVNGVGAVSVTGGDIREIQVQVRRDRLLAHELGVNDVLRAVQASTINVPSGRIVTETTETAVRMLGEFKTVDEVKNSVISVGDPRDPLAKDRIVLLGDIADVTDTTSERRESAQLNGRDSITITVQKASDGNEIQVSEGIRPILAQIEQEYGIQTVVTRDEASTVQESIVDLAIALVFGIILVTVVVYVFLHNVRGTLIIAIAIPCSFFATFIIMPWFGFTINNITMLALSLAVAVLIDDAIVVLENIYRHLTMGEDPVNAAINGRSEIGLAAIAITLADVVVFVPIALLPGVTGQFLRPLAITFSIAVLLSLFVSFTVTPMLASRWYRRGEDFEHPKGWFASRFEAGFSKFSAGYGRVLSWSLRHRWFVFWTGFAALLGVIMILRTSFVSSFGEAFSIGIGAAIIPIVVGFISFLVYLAMKMFRPMQIVYGAFYGVAIVFACLLGFWIGQWKGSPLFNFAFFPPSDTGQVQITIQLPPGTSLAETTRFIEPIEQEVMQNPNVEFVNTRIGSLGAGAFTAAETGTNYARITAQLYEKESILDRMQPWVQHEHPLRTESDNAVAAELLKSIGRVPGAQITVSAADQFGFGAAIQMSFSGSNRQDVLETAARVAAALREGAVQGVVNVDISSRPGKPELQAVPDRQRLADLGITVGDVGRSLRTLYEGNNDTKFRVDGREYDIRVLLDDADRNDPELVPEVPITFVQGRPIFLGQVTELQEGQGLDKIDRRDRREEIRVTADLLPGFAAGSVQGQIDQVLESEGLVPESVTYAPLGQADVQARETAALFGAILIGLVLVYMLLASLYDNLLYPFIIQLAQPQALVGALLALAITDKTFNIVGFIGVIALIGLVGKNAILLVDYTNTLRSRGMKREEALTTAGPVRLRPILMTSFTLIFGLMPVALAVGRGSEFRETLGIIIIGGIALSTILTLLVIPCSYLIFDNLSNKLSGKKPDDFQLRAGNDMTVGGDGSVGSVPPPTSPA
ncbi:MAG: efflux RND transporter permease subunit [Fimbriimonadaceae bacterium]